MLCAGAEGDSGELRKASDSASSWRGATSGNSVLTAHTGELANPQAEISFVLERKKPSAAGKPSTDFHTKRGLSGARPRAKMLPAPPSPTPPTSRPQFPYKEFRQEALRAILRF